MAFTINRDDSLRQAKVWLSPAWIGPDFKFDESLDVLAGPNPKTEDLKLLETPVRCEFTEKALTKEPGGRTRKFYCELPQKKESLVKVKYRFKNGEISGEMIGTRLLWALGFPADRMFFIERLECAGCSQDPFKDYRLDETSLSQPRVFENVAVERKFDAKEIKLHFGGYKYEGWSFSELMNKLPADKAARNKAKVEREALRLLSVFLMHGDNKDENQSLLCLGSTNPLGGCSGDTLLMIHDLGATFGKGYDPIEAGKTNLKDWSDAKIWSDPAKCIARLGPNSSEEMIEPTIPEEGRVFLANLLRGFVSGEAGQERVRDLFRAGRADLRGATIEEWTKVFLRKVDEIEFPLGSSTKNFQCPEKI